MPRSFASSPLSRRLFLTAAKPVGQAGIDKAMKTPTQLTFWTWVPNIDKEVPLFESKYPAIKVKVVWQSSLSAGSVKQ